MVVYENAAIYIETATSLNDKITKIDAVISALLSTALKSAANDHITEYNLDDGQTKIRTAYRGTAAIMNSIKEFETIKQMYVNQLNGRVMRLVDGKNFIGNRNGRW